MVMQGAKVARAEERAGMPAWVPEAARNYLAHVAGGAPIRALAREAQVHASTILRQVRRLEQQRDDPLVDELLRILSGRVSSFPLQAEDEKMGMERPRQMPGDDLTETRIRQEGLRILRRLVEPGAVLAVARDMERGVVVREGPDSSTQRIAVVDRTVAQAMALKEWIAAADPAARIARYTITATGRGALRQMLAEAGLAEAPARFAGAEAEDDRTLRHMRSLLGDSPVTALARRVDKDGTPFLPRDLVAVAERLREDFELCHAGPRVAQDWSHFLTAGISAGTGMGAGAAADARDRLRAALTDLGPGLADVALRCCCFLEGLESIEARMNWSARSGKIVLRIALQRLKRHYAETQGRFAPRIG